MRLQELHAQCDELADVRERIAATVEDEPPLTLSDGGVIRAGVDAALDELRDLSRNSKQYIAQIEQRERQRTGIGSLKVKFNNVFGYYLEISKANLQHAPADYERKQTLVNAERFTTPELKEYETKVLDAQEKIVEIERRLFAELRAAIAARRSASGRRRWRWRRSTCWRGSRHRRRTARYCRPRLDDSNDVEIVDGRHPVIEQQDLSGVADRFVPNDLYLNGTTHAVLVITGPNMGGKSTYLRQAALHRADGADGIVCSGAVGAAGAGGPHLHAHWRERQPGAGAVDVHGGDDGDGGDPEYGDAAVADICWTRWGAGLRPMTGWRLRGRRLSTSTPIRGRKTLFATHYHELTELAERLSGVKNFHVTVKESGGGIVFLRKVAEGAADKSYGIEVAKLAGLPADVIASRARGAGGA